VENFKVDGKLT